MLIIISTDEDTDEDPSLRIESFATKKLYFNLITYKELMFRVFIYT